MFSLFEHRPSSQGEDFTTQLKNFFVGGEQNKKQRRSTTDNNTLPTSVDDILKRVRRISIAEPEQSRSKSPAPRRRYSTATKPTAVAQRKKSNAVIKKT